MSRNPDERALRYVEFCVCRQQGREEGWIAGELGSESPNALYQHGAFVDPRRLSRNRSSADLPPVPPVKLLICVSIEGTGVRFSIASNRDRLPLTWRVRKEGVHPLTPSGWISLNDGVSLYPPSKSPQKTAGAAEIMLASPGRGATLVYGSSDRLFG